MGELAVILPVVALVGFVVGIIEGWALAGAMYRDGLRRMYADAGMECPDRLRKRGWRWPWAN